MQAHNPWSALVTATIIGASLVAIGTAAAQQPRARQPHQWTTYYNARFGTTADYPADIFTVRAPPPTNGDGQTFRTADGRAQLLIYGTHNAEEDNPRSYVAKYYNGPEVTYKRITRSFFVVSGVHDGAIFYNRCNFPAKAEGIIDCIGLNYPASDKAKWDAIVTRISSSLRAGKETERSE